MYELHVHEYQDCNTSCTCVRHRKRNFIMFETEIRHINPFIFHFISFKLFFTMVSTQYYVYVYTVLQGAMPKRNLIITKIYNITLFTIIFDKKARKIRY